jgi:hypothetical protein
MGAWKKLAERLASGSLVFFALQSGLLAVAQTTVGTRQAVQPVVNGVQQTPSLTELPDSPGATIARLQPPAPQQSSSHQSVPTVDEPQSQPTQPVQTQTQTPQRPVGTAAAEPMHASGIAASQPAGVAVAPAKQRRVRTIVIRVGAIIGAGIAVGTVVALTAGTSSKPPGAH